MEVFCVVEVDQTNDCEVQTWSSAFGSLESAQSAVLQDFKSGVCDFAEVEFGSNEGDGLTQFMKLTWYQLDEWRWETRGDDTLYKVTRLVFRGE